MIEVIYNEENNKNTVGRLHIPKNIRQIGEIEPKSGIYIEDYVCSYVEQIIKRDIIRPKAAVLLGNINAFERKQYIFVNGAIDITDYIEIKNGNYIFTDNLWSNVYEKLKKYFDNLEVVGWFLYLDQEKIQLNPSILKTHIDNFAGNNKVLMLRNWTSKDAEFYLYRSGQLMRQKGYFLYYEKNEQMKEYMIYKSEESYVDNQELVSDKAVKSFRSIIQTKKEESHQKKMMSFMYTASTFLVVVVFVIGITMMNNYDKMKNMEGVLNNISNSLLSKEENERPTDSEEEMEAKVKAENEKVLEETVGKGLVVEKVEGQVAAEEPPVSSTPQEEAPVNQDPSVTEETVETISATVETPETTVPQYYTVSKGETLLEISMKVYQTESRVNEICQLNQIDDGDKIYAGQQILLP